MRKIINIAVVLGAVFCLVGVALARTVWLPEYEEKFEGMDSCAAHGMLSEVEKDEKNLTCLNSQFIQWVGICYKNCRCKFEWTKQKCESKIGGVWRVSGRSCDDGTYVYWEDCVNGACDNRVDNNSEWGCKEYWEDCPSKCKIPYPDNCHNREDVRKDKNNGCAEFWEDCETKCKEEISCEPNDCSDYLLTQKPNNAVSVGECMIGCGDYAPRYKIEACNETFIAKTDASNNITACECPDVSELKDGKCECPDVSELKDGKCVCPDVSELKDGKCECPDVSKLKDGKCVCPVNATLVGKECVCKEGFKWNGDNTQCVESCGVELCEGYLLTKEPKYAESELCPNACAEEPLYKILQCNDGYELNVDETDCKCPGTYNSTGCPANAINCEECEDGEGKHYKFDGCPVNSSLSEDETECVCKEGFKWNGDNTQCVESCDVNKCKNDGYILEGDPADAIGAKTEKCDYACNDEKWYKILSCNDPFEAIKDENGNVIECQCPQYSSPNDEGKCVCNDENGSYWKGNECVCKGDGYDWTNDGKQCMPKCARDAYNNGQCSISSGWDGGSALLGDMTKDFSECIIDGRVKINIENTKALGVPKWAGKTFSSCGDGAEMLLSSLGSGSLWTKLEGNVKFDVKFITTNLSGNLYFGGANITFGKGAEIEAAIFSGGETVTVNGEVTIESVIVDDNAVKGMEIIIKKNSHFAATTFNNRSHAIIEFTLKDGAVLSLKIDEGASVDNYQCGRDELPTGLPWNVKVSCGG